MSLLLAVGLRRRGSIVLGIARSLDAGATAAVVCVVLVGCGGTDGPTQPGSPTAGVSIPSAPSASASASPADPAESALAAYRSMWRAFVVASSIPDPAYPDLSRFTDGDALKTLVGGVEDLRTKGLVNQGDVVLNPTVTATSLSVKPAQVQIKDCVNTAGTRLVKKDGSAYNDSPGGRRSAQIKVTETAEGWKVTSFALFEVGTC